MDPSAGRGWFPSLLMEDKAVCNESRERAGCQAKKLGGNFFQSYFVCTISCSLEKKGAILQHGLLVSSDKTARKLLSTKLGSSEL